MKRQRPKQIIVTHFALIDGQEVEINPAETDLPDRCKLVLAELVTGHKYELVKQGS